MLELVILDYSTGTVHFYKVDSNCTVDDEYINSLGFDINSSSWMIANKIDMFEHKGILC